MPRLLSVSVRCGAAVVMRLRGTNDDSTMGITFLSHSYCAVMNVTSAATGDEAFCWWGRMLAHPMPFHSISSLGKLEEWLNYKFITAGCQTLDDTTPPSHPLPWQSRGKTTFILRIAARRYSPDDKEWTQGSRKRLTEVWFFWHLPGE